MARRNTLTTAGLVGAIGVGGLLLFRQSRPGADPLDGIQDAIDGLFDVVTGSSQVSPTPGAATPSGGTQSPRAPLTVNDVPAERLAGTTTSNDLVAALNAIAVDDAVVVTDRDNQVFINRGFESGALSALSDEEFDRVAPFVKERLR